MAENVLLQEQRYKVREIVHDFIHRFIKYYVPSWPIENIIAFSEVFARSVVLRSALIHEAFVSHWNIMYEIYKTDRDDTIIRISLDHHAEVIFLQGYHCYLCLSHLLYCGAVGAYKFVLHNEPQKIALFEDLLVHSIKKKRFITRALSLEGGFQEFVRYCIRVILNVESRINPPKVKRSHDYLQLMDKENADPNADKNTISNNGQHQICNIDISHTPAPDQTTTMIQQIKYEETDHSENVKSHSNLGITGPQKFADSVKSLCQTNQYLLSDHDTAQLGEVRNHEMEVNEPYSAAAWNNQNDQPKISRIRDAYNKLLIHTPSESEEVLQFQNDVNVKTASQLEVPGTEKYSQQEIVSTSDQMSADHESSYVQQPLGHLGVDSSAQCLNLENVPKNNGSGNALSILEEVASREMPTMRETQSTESQDKALHIDMPYQLGASNTEMKPQMKALNNQQESITRMTFPTADSRQEDSLPARAHHIAPATRTMVPITPADEKRFEDWVLPHVKNYPLIATRSESRAGTLGPQMHTPADQDSMRRPVSAFSVMQPSVMRSVLSDVQLYGNVSTSQFNPDIGPSSRYQSPCNWVQGERTAHQLNFVSGPSARYNENYSLLPNPDAHMFKWVGNPYTLTRGFLHSAHTPRTSSHVVSASSVVSPSDGISYLDRLKMFGEKHRNSHESTSNTKEDNH